MSGVLFRLAALALLSLLSCTVAVACRCIQQSERASVAFKKSDAVFSGKVVTIKGPRARREGNRVEFIGEFVEVTFRVVRSWKFVDSSEITILTPLSSCGYRFKVGEQYLVWADLNEDAPAKLVTHLCTRTDTLAYAGRDLKYLGKGKKPTVKERVANHNQPSSQRRDSAFRVV